jgi:hypothetical protein
VSFQNVSVFTGTFAMMKVILQTLRDDQDPDSSDDDTDEEQE